MKNGLRIVILAALVLSAACSRYGDDQEKYGLCTKAREVTLQCDSLEFPYTARFNSRGQLESVETRNFDESFRCIESYSYNPKGELEEIAEVNSDGEQEARYEYEMDGRFVRECRIYGMNNQEVHRWVHENDGKHIVKTDYYAEGTPEYVTTKVFNGSHYTEESHNMGGELLGHAEVDFVRNENRPSRICGDDVDIEIAYNDKGLPVMSRGAVLNSRGELHWVSDLEVHPVRYYSYKYDRRGNWIVRAERKSPDGPDELVIRRTIIY